MKRILTAAMLLSFLGVSVAAFADPPNRGDQRRGEHRQQQHSRPDKQHSSRADNRHQGRGKADRLWNKGKSDGRYDGRRNYRDNRAHHGRRDYRDDGRHHGRRDSRAYSRPYSGHYSGRNALQYRSSRGSSIGDYGRSYSRPYARYRAAAYHRPQGYYRHAWRRGERLPSHWYGHRYIVHDYHAYHLRRPPYGYHWVRVDGDVVLAAIAGGLIADVMYDLFF